TMTSHRTNIGMRPLFLALQHKFNFYYFICQLDRDRCNHSLTVFDVRGGFTDNNKEMLMVMVDNANYGHMLRLIHDIDQDAFIVTTNVTEVHGGTFGI
ncbi:YitT family protein, partial [Weissella confusa]|nr:YitT family protein [Weissella confusa]MBJ7639546.1 YitT family protein [Weissella confusa]MBJ7646074.1 YitT family protein [Weissella confusa]